MTPLAFPDAQPAGEDALVLLGWYCQWVRPWSWELFSALYFLWLLGTKTQGRIYLCAGDTVSIADSHFAPPLYLQSWLPKPALDQRKAKQRWSSCHLSQPPGYLLVKSTAGLEPAGCKRHCTEGITSPLESSLSLPSQACIKRSTNEKLSLGACAQAPKAADWMRTEDSLKHTWPSTA